MNPSTRALLPALGLLFAANPGDKLVRNKLPKKHNPKRAKQKWLKKQKQQARRKSNA